MPVIMKNNIAYVGSYDSQIKELTLDEYTALEASGKVNPEALYFITDANEAYDASKVIYDNTKNSIKSGTVQGAIDELNSNLSKNLTRPDYSAITDITVLPSKPTINSTETFTCPDNGYISIYAYNAIQAGTMHLIINNFEVLLISGNVPNATSNIFIPVSKNDIVRLKTDMQTENWTIEQCRFIKMK